MSKKALLIALLAGGILLSSVINLFVGSSGMTVEETAAALLRQGTVNENLIVWDIRMPVVLSAVAIGAALGIAGCEMQTILRNPMASAYTWACPAQPLSGRRWPSSLRIGLITVVGKYMVAANSLLFTLLASVTIITFAKKFNSDRGVIILFGIALNFLFSSLTRSCNTSPMKTICRNWFFGLSAA